MAIEREVKLVIRPVPKLFGAHPDKVVGIRQGFVELDHPGAMFRVREKRKPDGSREFFLTFKFTFADDPERRIELEDDADKETAEKVFRQAGHLVIEKDRLTIDGWEIDWFHGKLEGLWVAEYEFEDGGSMPELPPWMELVEDVTGVMTYTNISLVKLTTTEAQEFVRLAMIGLT